MHQKRSLNHLGIGYVLFFCWSSFSELDCACATNRYTRAGSWHVGEQKELCIIDQILPLLPLYALETSLTPSFSHLPMLSIVTFLGITLKHDNNTFVEFQNIQISQNLSPYALWKLNVLEPLFYCDGRNTKHGNMTHM